jgi:hypothetical protein
MVSICAAAKISALEFCPAEVFYQAEAMPA